MRVFITGMQSFVGQELVRQCKEKGIAFGGVDLAGTDEPHCHKADIRSADLADFIPDGIDAVVHLAAMSRDPDCKNKAYECFDANVMGTLNLINAAQKKNVRQFIFASTEWTYDSFKVNEIKDEDFIIDISKLTSEYALSKLVSEANLRQKFMHGFCPVMILRFGIIYGSREKNWSAVETLFHAVKTKEEVRVGSLRTGRCFVHVQDIAAGIIKALGKTGFNIINLEGDHLVTLGEVIETAKKVLHKDPKVVEIDPGSANIRNVSNKKAKDLLGWQPQVDLVTGLKQLDAFITRQVK